LYEETLWRYFKRGGYFKEAIRSSLLKEFLLRERKEGEEQNEGCRL
jgi:hypothetical protein